MMASNAAIKSAAKQAMQGKFLLCLIGACVPMFAAIAGDLVVELPLYFGADMLVFIPLLLAMIAFLCVPMFVGTLRFFWLISKDREPNPAEIFHYFKCGSDYWHCFTVMLPVIFRSILSGILLFFPSIITLTFANRDFYREMKWSVPDYLPLVEVFGFLLAAAAAVLWIIYLLRYCMIPFLLIAAPNMIQEEISFYSAEIYKRTAYRTFRYVLSYWPWILLSLLVFPLVFTLPYFMSGWVAYCRFAIGQYNEEARQSGKQPIYISPIEEENCREENRI